MSLASLVRRRRMTRRFAADPQVPEADIAGWLDLASRAPSAGNTQAGAYVVLRTDAERTTFWTAAAPASGRPDRWLRGVQSAPTLIVCVSDEAAYRSRYAEPDKGSTPPAEQDWPIPYWHTDLAMGVMTVLLAATEAGTGALFFGVPGPAHARVKEALGIPLGRGLLGVIALGTEAQRVRSPSLDRPRRRGPEVTHWGRFGARNTPDGAGSATIGHTTQ